MKIEQQAPRAFAELSIDLETSAEMVKCKTCGTDIEGGVIAAFKDSIVCDDCLEKYIEEEKIRVCRGKWHEVCPPLYRNNDRKHPTMRPLWNICLGVISSVDGDSKNAPVSRKSIILTGRSGTAKTRCMMEMLKTSLLASQTISVMWADELDAAIETGKLFKYREEHNKADVLGIDDFLTSGSSNEKMTKMLKGLIDERLRYGKQTIITTNLAARDIASDSDKFGNATHADGQRIEAIVRRIRQEYVTIDTDTLTLGVKY